MRPVCTGGFDRSLHILIDLHTYDFVSYLFLCFVFSHILCRKHTIPRLLTRFELFCSRQYDTHNTFNRSVAENPQSYPSSNVPPNSDSIGFSYKYIISTHCHTLENCPNFRDLVWTQGYLANQTHWIRFIHLVHWSTSVAVKHWSAIVCPVILSVITPRYNIISAFQHCWICFSLLVGITVRRFTC